MNKRLKSCPVCNSKLEILKYHCPNCDTKIEGKFEIGELDSLSPQQQEFVKVFICSEGNIKKVEEIMDISYPTVKNRLSEIKQILCPETQEKKTESQPEMILANLDKGSISVKEAIKKLKERKKNE